METSSSALIMSLAQQAFYRLLDGESADDIYLNAPPESRDVVRSIATSNHDRIACQVNKVLDMANGNEARLARIISLVKCEHTKRLAALGKRMPILWRPLRSNDK